MEDPRFVKQRINARFQENPTNRGKSCSHLLLKFLLIGLLLSLLPLFPSDPPEFISRTIFAQTWELIRLFIIGIVLSYGLFCSLKSPQVPPKPQISQPYVTNILHHASLFDYEDENASRNIEKDAIPSQRCNFSPYRTEPYVVVRRENCKTFDERPLGLPVRSLRTRIVESDSSDSDGDGGCDSECDSDICDKSSDSKSSGIPTSGNDQNLEANVGNLSPIPWNSRSMTEAFRAENGKFDMNRLPTQASYLKNYGMCSWLPQSPNVEQYPVRIPPMVGLSSMEEGTSWRRENFEMPVSGFSTQGYGSNMMGMPPNLEKENLGWEEGKFYVPSVEAPSSMVAPTNDFVSRSRRYSHERVNLGEPLIFENEHLGREKTGYFMPSAEAPPSVSVPERDFTSSINPSRSRKFNNEIGDLGISPSLEHENLSGENTSFFMPSVSVPEMDFASSLKPLRPREINHEIGHLGISPNLDSRQTDFFMPSAASVPDRVYTSPIKPSNFGDLGVLPNFELGNLGIEKISSFMPAPIAPSPVLAPEKDFGSSMNGSRPMKFNDENRDSGTSPNLENGNFDGHKTCSFMPSAAEPSAVSPPEKDISSSIKLSRSKNFIHGNDDQGKSPNLLKDNLGAEKIKSLRPLADGPSSVSAFEKSFALSMSLRIHPRTSPKKEKEELKKDIGGNLGQLDDLSSPHVDLLSMPTPKGDFASSTNGSFAEEAEQKTIPKKWDDDCFAIPSLENNNVGDVDQEDLSHESACSSETPSPAGSSSRRSGVQLSPQSKVGGSVSLSSSANSSEIEELGEDNDAYKPSTPSPPPQVQTRRNDFPSSVESSSNALANISLLDDDDDLGSPPTPERGKALSRRSHSRRFSCGSFFERDQRKGFKDDHAKEANRKISKRGNSCGWDCLKLDVKPALTKAALKGKSVRTIRPRETPLDTQREPPQREEKREENTGTSMGKMGERKGENPGMVVIQIGISEKRPNSSNGKRGDQKQGSGATSIILGLNSKESSKVKATDVKEEETDSDEIDRKAGEFIAKFKEQMRLQKVAARAESNRGRQQLPQRNSMRTS